MAPLSKISSADQISVAAANFCRDFFPWVVDRIFVQGNEAIQFHRYSSCNNFKQHFLIETTSIYAYTYKRILIRHLIEMHAREISMYTRTNRCMLALLSARFKFHYRYLSREYDKLVQCL